MKKTTKLVGLNPKTKPVNADQWVGRSVVDMREGETATKAKPAPAEPMKRFTIDVSESLHKRIKAECAIRGAKMADVMRSLLEREFPEQKA